MTLGLPWLLPKKGRPLFFSCGTWIRIMERRGIKEWTFITSQHLYHFIIPGFGILKSKLRNPAEIHSKLSQPKLYCILYVYYYYYCVGSWRLELGNNLSIFKSISQLRVTKLRVLSGKGVKEEVGPVQNSPIII
jgi:hypothetical protein